MLEIKHFHIQTKCHKIKNDSNKAKKSVFTSEYFHPVLKIREVEKRTYLTRKKLYVKFAY